MSKLTGASGRCFTDALLLISSFLASMGFPPSCSKVLATLYLSEKPLSSRELREATGYSKSTIAAAIKVLLSRKLVCRVREGKRRLYALNSDLGHLFFSAHEGVIERVKSKTRELRERAGLPLSSRLVHLEEELNQLLERFRGSP